MQHIQSGLQLSSEAFEPKSLASLPKNMNHWLLFIPQLESKDCSDGSFLEYSTDGARWCT